MQQYSIALDLLLTSVAASVKGKYEQSAKLFDAALRSPDLAKMLSTLDKEQADALTAYKAKKAEKAGAKPAAAEDKKEVAAATAGQRMAGFLKELHATREAAKVKPTTAAPAAVVKDTKTAAAPTKTDKKTKPATVKADTQDDNFDDVIDKMTQATTIDQILDPALDMTDDGCDDGADDGSVGEHIERPAPAVKADADPSPGNGESSLDTDQDDAMDLDDLDDLSDEDFGEHASSDDEDEDDEDEDKDDDKSKSEEASDDSDDKKDDKEDKKDKDGDKGDDKKDKDGDKKDLPPFMKKDDKAESKTVAPAKAAFTRTISNLTALDRLSALTASMVDGTIKQKVKERASVKKAAADKAAKTASKK